MFENLTDQFLVDSNDLPIVSCIIDRKSEYAITIVNEDDLRFLIMFYDLESFTKIN